MEISVVSRCLAIEVNIPGKFLWEVIGKLHELEGSRPGESNFVEPPDRYYRGPEDCVRVRFLIGMDMENDFYDLLKSFSREKGTTFIPSGAVASARAAT
jgi:hypothetical protein